MLENIQQNLEIHLSQIVRERDPYLASGGQTNSQFAIRNSQLQSVGQTVRPKGA